jgi:ArsR family transcriptional regulator
VQNALKLFKAFSDETRLRIVNLLLERECSVCEVMQAMEISQTRASRGLTALYNTGILKARRDGLWVLYSVNEDAMEESYDCLFQLVRRALRGDEVADGDRERLKGTVRVSPCTGHARPLEAQLPKEHISTSGE